MIFLSILITFFPQKFVLIMFSQHFYDAFIAMFFFFCVYLRSYVTCASKTNQKCGTSGLKIDVKKCNKKGMLYDWLYLYDLDCGPLFLASTFSCLHGHIRPVLSFLFPRAVPPQTL